MRCLVCGDRNWTNRDRIKQFLQTLPRGTVVVEGGCRGADLLARSVAEEIGLPVEEHPADWNTHGKAAGPIRNQEMVDSALDLAFVFHSDLSSSRGTKDMVSRLEKTSVPYIHIKE